MKAHPTLSTRRMPPLKLLLPRLLALPLGKIDGSRSRTMFWHPTCKVVCSSRPWWLCLAATKPFWRGESYGIRTLF